MLLFFRKIQIVTIMMFRLAIANWCFIQAWDKTVYKKYQEAENLFDKGEKLITTSPFIGVMLLETKIIKAYIKYLVNKYSESLELFENIWCEIEKNEDNELTEQDQIYLKEYIYSTAKICLGFIQVETRNQQLSFKNIHPVEIDAIDLQKVSKKWKKKFPSRNHPDWGKHGA